MEDSISHDIGMTPIYFSKGRDKYDNRPVADSIYWGELGAWLERNRARAKGLDYITSDFKGDGRRCKENAYPRNWIVMDLDDSITLGKINTEENVHHILGVMQRFAGYGYETFSSRKDGNSIRMRFIILCNRNFQYDGSAFSQIAQDEMHHIGNLLALKIFKINPTHWDTSVWRHCQPIYLPPPNVPILRFEGDVLNIDSAVKHFPIPKPKVYQKREFSYGEEVDVLLWFKNNNLIIREKGDGKFDVRCPWEEYHGHKDRSGAVLYARGSQGISEYRFCCHHQQHGKKSIGDVYRLIRGGK